eukprot:12474-Eustigmatos_ZCMA.PRE.1
MLLRIVAQRVVLLDIEVVSEDLGHVAQREQRHHDAEGLRAHLPLIAIQIPRHGHRAGHFGRDEEAAIRQRIERPHATRIFS